MNASNGEKYTSLAEIKRKYFPKAYEKSVSDDESWDLDENSKKEARLLVDESLSRIKEALAKKGCI